MQTSSFENISSLEVFNGITKKFGSVVIELVRVGVVLIDIVCKRNLKSGLLEAVRKPPCSAEQVRRNRNVLVGQRLRHPFRCCDFLHSCRHVVKVQGQLESQESFPQWPYRFSLRFRLRTP